MPKATPESIKAEALELVRNGATSRAAADVVGVGKSSVTRWGQSQGIVAPTERTPTAAIAANRERYAAKRAVEAQESIAVAEVARGKVLEYLADDRPSDARQASIVYGVMLDKHLLLTGEATSRHERTLSPDEQRLRVAELLAALEQRRDGASGQLNAE